MKARMITPRVGAQSRRLFYSVALAALMLASASVLAAPEAAEAPAAPAAAKPALPAAMLPVVSPRIGVPINPSSGVYRETQQRLSALDEGAPPVAGYALAKAQCWVNVSYHEFTRNDRGAFTAGALAESRRIVSALEGGSDPAAQATPLFGGQRLREDLWERMERLHHSAGLSCAVKNLACAEVELAESGHAISEAGWRHANPYLMITEERLADAEQQAATCAGPVAAVAEVVVTEVLVLVPEPVKLVLSADALFAFDRSDTHDIKPNGREQLEAFALQVKTHSAGIERLRVAGYTDRLGSAAYNLALSARRAHTVREVLRHAGVGVPIEEVGMGEADQVIACGGAMRATPELEKCLEPNRRVEVEVIRSGK